MIQAGLIPPHVLKVQPGQAYHINQRDEGIDLHGVSGALMHTQNMQMQTFVTQPGNCLNPWDTQQSRIFTPNGKAPTLAGADGGGGRNPAGLLFTEALSPDTSENDSTMLPDVLCLNDQGGAVMEYTEDISGTLRAQEHGHQPLVYENHGIDSRYTGPHDVAPTMSARYGTGGNNLPLVEQDASVTSTELAEEYILSARMWVDKCIEAETSHTEGALQYAEAMEQHLQSWEPGKTPLLIRRLTPLECERLQGFPDGWTQLPDASDSARYRALGNSVAMPCVEFVMRGIAKALEEA